MKYSLSRDIAARFREQEAAFFHAVLGNAFSCEPAIARFLLDLAEPLPEEQLLQRLSKLTGSQHAARDAFEFLVTSGYLLSASGSPRQAIPSAKDFLLRLVITERCNYRCTYCYESLEGRTHGRTMSLDTGRNALRYLRSHFEVDDFDCLEFRVYGGEPLLVPELVLQMFDLARSEFARLGDRLFLMLNSNGSLVTSMVAKQLLERGVKVAISLDGLRDHNDANRLFPDGAGTYDATLKGIRRLVSEGVALVVNVTVTDSNLHSLCVIVDVLADLGIRYVSLNRLKPGPGVAAPTIGPNYYSEFIAEAVKAYRHARQKGIWAGGLWARYLDRLVDAEARYCTACGHQMVVSPAGDVYSCPHLYGESSFSWGNVNSDTFLEEEYLRYCNRTPERIEECASCYIRGICSGGCPAVAYYQSGTIYAPESCEFHKLAVEELLWELPEE